MPLTQTYADGYLAALVTVDRETRATADVTALGTFPAAWVTRLVILRAYIIACIECQKSPDDTFSAKLSSYRKEYAEALPQARAAQQAADLAADGVSLGVSSIFTVALERG